MDGSGTTKSAPPPPPLSPPSCESGCNIYSTEGLWWFRVSELSSVNASTTRFSISLCFTSPGIDSRVNEINDK